MKKGSYRSRYNYLNIKGGSNLPWSGEGVAGSQFLSAGDRVDTCQGTSFNTCSVSPATILSSCFPYTTRAVNIDSRFTQARLKQLLLLTSPLALEVHGILKFYQFSTARSIGCYYPCKPGIRCFLAKFFFSTEYSSKSPSVTRAA